MSEALPARVGWREFAIAIALATLWVTLVRPGPLSLPYFWDESDVYVPGARWVAEHGLTVTPGVFPDDYSRGHPPLLYWLAAVAFRSFGTDPLVGHLVVLPFTALALAATYLLGAAVFGRHAGGCAAVLLGTTPLFMSIGNMLLPEVPLTALAALSLFAFARGRLVPAALLGVAAVWMKETGIFAAGAIGAGVLFDAWRRRALGHRATWGRAALAAAPLFALLAFFVWQKIHAGYYIFPHHQNLFADRPLELANVLTVWPSLLARHGRWIAILGALMALSLGHAPRPPELAPPRWTPSRGAVVFACLALVLFNALFFTKMFWLDRYALPAHPGVLVCACGALFAGLGAISERARTWIATGVVLATALLGVLSMRAPAPPDSEEVTFAYADVIATHRLAFEALRPRDSPVLTTWPMTVELEEPYLGYVSRPLETIHARTVDAADGVGAILVNTASSRALELRREAERRGMERVARFREGVAPALELYRPAEP